MNEDKLYLSPIKDLCTGEIISYALSTSPNYKQINDMLNKEFSKYKNLKGLIFFTAITTIKNEMFYGKKFENIEKLKVEIKDYTQCYNTERIQVGLKGKSLLQFRRTFIS